MKTIRVLICNYENMFLSYVKFSISRKELQRPLHVGMAD